MPKIEQQISERFNVLRIEAENLKIAFVQPDLDELVGEFKEWAADTLKCTARLDKFLDEDNSILNTLKTIESSVDELNKDIEATSENMAILMDLLPTLTLLHSQGSEDLSSDEIQKITIALAWIKSFTQQRMIELNNLEPKFNPIFDQLSTQRAVINALKKELDEVKKLSKPKTDVFNLYKTTLECIEGKWRLITEYLEKVGSLYNLLATGFETDKETITNAIKIHGIIAKPSAFTNPVSTTTPASAPNHSATSNQQPAATNLENTEPRPNNNYTAPQPRIIINTINAPSSTHFKPAQVLQVEKNPEKKRTCCTIL